MRGRCVIVGWLGSNPSYVSSQERHRQDSCGRKCRGNAIHLPVYFGTNSWYHHGRCMPLTGFQSFPPSAWCQRRAVPKLAVLLLTCQDWHAGDMHLVIKHAHSHSLHAPYLPQLHSSGLGPSCQHGIFNLSIAPCELVPVRHFLKQTPKLTTAAVEPVDPVQSTLK